MAVDAIGARWILVGLHAPRGESEILDESSGQKIGIGAVAAPAIAVAREVPLALDQHPRLDASSAAGEIKLDDVLAESEDEGEGAAKAPAPTVSADDVSTLAAEIREVIAEQPMYFIDLSKKFADRGVPLLARAIGELHENEELWQDHLGRFCLVGSDFAAKLN